jgi:hypothetical protein
MLQLVNEAGVDECLEALIPNGLEADPSRDRDGGGAIGSRVFFSEEKKQKTFVSSSACAAMTVRDSN